MHDDVIEGTALVVREEYSALPAVSPIEAREAMRAYQELCASILDRDDYQEFSQKKKVDGRWTSVTSKFKKKSAVKKLQTFFGVDVRIRDTQRDDLGDGHFGFRVIATAQHKNGRVVEAAGGCSTFEERFDLVPYDDETDAKFEARARKARARSYHDVLSTAETRATNRAVMNAIGVGGGEVTADEVQRPSRAQQPPVDHEEQKDKARKRLFADFPQLKDDEYRMNTCMRLFNQRFSNLNLAQLRELYKEMQHA